MEKSYFLKKTDFFDLKISELRYKFNPLLSNKPTKFIRIIIHHTGIKKTMQDIIDTHIKKNHYSKIGYHFVISKSGNIYYTRNLKYSGAHTYHHNRNSIDIALIGHFNEEKPTQKQINALNNLVQTLKKNYSIKEILAHNEAIYKYVKGKYFKLNLENINLLDINDLELYKNFLKKTTTTILNKSSDIETIQTIKKLSFCPGINMFKIVKELKKDLQLTN